MPVIFTKNLHENDLHPNCQRTWLFFCKLKQVFVWGVKINTGGRFFWCARSQTSYTQPHVQLHLHTQDDWFPLRVEIWPWRQDYGGESHSLFLLSLGFLPWGPWPIIECFFNLCFTPQRKMIYHCWFFRGSRYILGLGPLTNSYTMLQDEESSLSREGYVWQSIGEGWGAGGVLQ